MYITFEEYIALYEPIEEKLFNRLLFDACRHIDRLTTGVDGVKKLKESFPADEDSASAVKRCAAQIVNLLYQIHEAENTASLIRGYTKTEDGLQGNIITSRSAGNESISFSTGSAKTAIDSAVTDQASREKLIYATIREYLSGLTDLNGVNLLYMGVYPRV